MYHASAWLVCLVLRWTCLKILHVNAKASKTDTWTTSEPSGYILSAAGFYLHIRCRAVLSVGRRGRYRSTPRSAPTQASGSFVCSFSPIIDFGCSVHLTSFLVTAKKAVRDRASNLVLPSPLRYKIVVISCACVMPSPTWYWVQVYRPYICRFFGNSDPRQMFASCNRSQPRVIEPCESRLTQISHSPGLWPLTGWPTGIRPFVIHQKLESGPACYRPLFPSFLNYYSYHLDRLFQPSSVIVSFLTSLSTGLKCL